MTREPAVGKIVILGAGPTGLGTGLGVALNSSGKSVVIAEKRARPGGLAGSFEWRGHTIDFGPHRLSANLRVVRTAAVELLGPDCLINPSQHGVQFHGKLYQFPPRISDWITPKSFWHLIAFAASFFFSKLWWVFIRFDRDTFESLIVRRFGRRFYRLIAEPMARKVWTAEPQDIDPAFASQRFTVVEPAKVLTTLIVPRQEINPSFFYYPRKGFQQLWTNMADYLLRCGQTLSYDCVPVRLDVDSGRIVSVVLRSPQGETRISGEDLQVVSTIPVMSLLPLIKGFPVDPLVELAKTVRALSMVLVSFEFDAPKTLPFRTLIFPETRFCFNRLFEQNQYSPESVGPGKSVVTADVTYPREGPQAGWEDSRFIEQVRSGLAELPYVDLGRVAAAHVERVEFAYIVPNVRTRRAMFEIHHALKRISNLELVGRFSSGEYDNSDYAIDQGLALGGMLCGRVSKLDYLCTVHGQRGRVIVG